MNEWEFIDSVKIYDLDLKRKIVCLESDRLNPLKIKITDSFIYVKLVNIKTDIIPVKIIGKIEIE